MIKENLFYFLYLHASYLPFLSFPLLKHSLGIFVACVFSALFITFSIVAPKFTADKFSLLRHSIVQ